MNWSSGFKTCCDKYSWKRINSLHVCCQKPQRQENESNESVTLAVRGQRHQRWLLAFTYNASNKVWKGPYLPTAPLTQIWGHFDKVRPPHGQLRGCSPSAQLQNPDELIFESATIRIPWRFFLFPQKQDFILFLSWLNSFVSSPPPPTPLFTKALPRQRIQLAFDKNYYIEPSFECRFDHIEIRDGPFGFSPLIDRFCGGKNPGLVTSTGRFMWIKFTSDEELEGLGFRIKYTFIAGQDSLNRIFAADAIITLVSFLNTSKSYVQWAESGYCALETPPPNHESQFSVCPLLNIVPVDYQYSVIGNPAASSGATWRSRSRLSLTYLTCQQTHVFMRASWTQYAQESVSLIRRQILASNRPFSLLYLACLNGILSRVLGLPISAVWIECNVLPKSYHFRPWFPSARGRTAKPHPR